MPNPLRWLIGPPLELADVPVQAAVGPPTPPAGAYVPGINVPTTTAEMDALVFGAGLLSRETAMGVPAITRARDLICGSISVMPLRTFRVTYDPAGVEVGEQPIPPYFWLRRPDPAHSRSWLLSATTDDLIFHGFAIWRIRDRYANGFPSSFQYLPWQSIFLKVNLITGVVEEVSFHGDTVPLADVVLFESPLAPVLSYGARAINIALSMDAAAERFSRVETPSGYLQQTDGSEPMDVAELTNLASSWTRNRATNATAALNNAVRWVESTYDPNKLELVEARNAQGTEMARLMNVPAALIQAPTNARMTYANVGLAKQDLFDLGILPLLVAIEQGLSGDNVTPRGQIVRCDPTMFLRNPWLPEGGVGVGMTPQPPAATPPGDATTPPPDQGGTPAGPGG